MYLRHVVVVGIFNIGVAEILAPRLLGLFVLGGLVAFAQYRLSGASPPVGEDHEAPRNPLELGSATIFAALFILVSILAGWVQRRYGEVGIDVLAAVVGVTDIDPFVLNIAQGAASTVTPGRRRDRDHDRHRVEQSAQGRLRRRVRRHSPGDADRSGTYRARGCCCDRGFVLLKRNAMKKENAYHEQLTELQIELVKLQSRVIAQSERLLIILEGRDAAGEDGTIKHIIEHLSPRDTRVVALPPPTERDRHSWYFERYVAELPAGGEMVLFNRSWYNRAGVERVMGFCSKKETREFLEAAPIFEDMLVRDGIKLFKYYLDITKKEQKQRLRDREVDPLKSMEIESDRRRGAQKHWDDYSKARNKMLLATHSLHAPWTVVDANDKHAARLNVMRDLLSRLDYKGKEKKLTPR